MNSFYSLYNRLVNASVAGRLDEELLKVRKLPDFDEHHLKCLLHPEKQAPVMRISDCPCSGEEKTGCKDSCLFAAISNDKDGNINISGTKCTGCALCIENCKSKNLTDRKDILPVLELLHKSEVPVYAMIAPAFTSQFSEEVTPGKLRSAFLPATSSLS